MEREGERGRRIQKLGRATLVLCVFAFPRFIEGKKTKEDKVKTVNENRKQVGLGQTWVIAFYRKTRTFSCQSHMLKYMLAVLQHISPKENMNLSTIEAGGIFLIYELI